MSFPYKLATAGRPCDEFDLEVAIGDGSSIMMLWLF